MKLPIVFMFSGQGSQYYQMGKALFESNKTFKERMQKADSIIQDLIGMSVMEEMYNNQNNKSTPFTRTLLTHPAIFMVECALVEVMREHKIHPDIILGTSMGEFAAAVTAGVLSFEFALEAIVKAALSLELCPEGTMLAILANPGLYQQQEYLNRYSELAAINFLSHFVVSGSKDNLTKIMSNLNKNNITSQLLPVSQAFHSSMIDIAKMPFLQAIQSIPLQKPVIPYLSGAEANFLSSLTHHHFWDTARKPILFKNTIEYLENQHPSLYLDVGPSGTLATFVKYNLTAQSQSKIFPLLSPFSDDIKNVETVLDKCC
jgi:bacillaene synthase trans-acting acyltransferase